MREFVVKTKKMKVTIDGTSYEMRCPSVGESEVLQEKIKLADNVSIYKTYRDFFCELGLPEEVIVKMDSEDFLSFIKFVLNPNLEGSQPTQT